MDQIQLSIYVYINRLWYAIELYDVQTNVYIYNICCHLKILELLPPYFNMYQTIISHAQHSTPRYALRPSARPLIKLPRINHTFAETRVLYQLIHLPNLTHEHTPEILIKNKFKKNILTLVLVGMLNRNIWRNILMSVCLIYVIVVDASRWYYTLAI